MNSTAFIPTNWFCCLTGPLSFSLALVWLLLCFRSDVISPCFIYGYEKVQEIVRIAAEHHETILRSGPRLHFLSIVNRRDTHFSYTRDHSKPKALSYVRSAHNLSWYFQLFQMWRLQSFVQNVQRHSCLCNQNDIQ